MAEKIFLIIFFLFMILISFVYMIHLLKNSEYHISRKELFYFIFIFLPSVILCIAVIIFIIFNI